MSLRSVGNQLLQTAPSHLLDGATVASASFWVQVNPANNVTNAGGVEIFGDSGGVFSATLLGTDLLRLQWTSVNATNPVTSTCTVGLVPGTSYHVATTWRTGLQVYYLNGVAIETDTQGGALGLSTGVKSRPFQLGSNQAGTDVTLGHPTLWVGYALTATDVVALRNGTTQPGSIAASSLALEWSLNGKAGASAAVGDPGLADGSPNALALSKIVGSAPTYQPADLTYTPAPTFAKVTASPSGESIILIVEDSQGNLLDVSAVQGSESVQVLQINGEPAGNAISLSFGGATTTPLATTTSPPPIYFLWTPPTTAGHAYSIAAYWWTDFEGLSGLSYYFETLDGSNTLATRLITSTPTSDQFTDPNSSSSYGAASWIPITPSGGVKASGSTLGVRITAASYNYAIGALRVQDLTANTVTFYNLQLDGSGHPIATPNYSFVPSSGLWSGDANALFYGGVRYTGYGNAKYGPVTVISPSGTTSAATLLQNALEAIPAIGPNNLAVVDKSSGGAGSYQITFGGMLGDSLVPAIACADPAVSITVVAPGGQGFTINRANGTSLLVGDVAWSEAADCAFLQLTLPQAKPQVETWTVRQAPCVLGAGYWDGPDYSLSTSLSKDPLFGWSAGLTASFGAQWLPVGTYQWAITWPNQPFTINGRQYTPSTATQFLLQDGSGNTLATYTIDQTKAPSGYVDANGTSWHVLGTSNVTVRDTILTLVMTTVGQSAAASGQTQVVAILDAVQFIRTSADTTVVLESGDALSVPAGFVSTASGPIPALVNMPIAPASSTAIMPAFVAGPKTMKLGWGLGEVGYPDDFPVFSNLSYNMNTMGIAQNSNGYPTRIHSVYGVNTDPVIERNPWGMTVGQPYQGATYTPAGKYLLTWDGDPIFSLTPLSGTTLTPIVVSRPAGAPANWQVYNATFDTNITNRVEFSLETRPVLLDPTDPTGQTYVVNLSNLGIYPPDPSDPTGQTIWGLSSNGLTWTKPPKFTPHYVEKLNGANCLRFMNPLNINQQPASTFDFFKPDTHANRTTPTYYTTLVNGTNGQPVNVVSIRPATTAECPILSGIGPVIVIETTGNSNFFDGAIFNFANCGTATFSGSPASAVLDTPTDGLYGIVIGIIDATHLLGFINWQPLGVMTNTVTGGILLGQGFGTHWSLQDVIDLVTAVGPSCARLHLNVPLTIDISTGGAITQFANFMATKLPTWVNEVTVEPSNEIWNYSFPQCHWATARSILDYGSPTSTPPGSSSPAPFHARRGKAFHDAFETAFTAAGRPGVVRRLFGSQAGQGSVTTAILDQLKAMGAPTAIDEVCVAFYVNPWPSSGGDPDQMPIFDRMTTGQLLDYGELIAEYGGYPAQFITNQLAAFQQYNLPNAKVVAYEGSMSGLVPIDPPDDAATPPGNTPDYAIRSHAATRHPRMFGIMLRHCQKFQDAGAYAWCYFYIGGSTSDNPWSCWASDTQPYGTGNPVTDSIGITNPMDLNNAPNQIAGALRTWANLVPTPSTGNKYIPQRNGRLRTTGLSHGVARPTRFR